MKKVTRNKKGNFNGAPVRPSVSSVSESSASDDPKKRLSRPFMVGLVVIIVVILAAVGFYIFGVTRENAQIPNTANLEVAQVQQLIDNVSKLMDIPEKEAPIMAIVSEAANLKSQPFFKNAQDGDRVMIFKSTKQAILYRASDNKIISATFITDEEIEAFQKLTQGDSNPESSPSADIKAPEDPSKPKVVVLNGTKEAGLAKKAGDLLEEDDFEFAGTGNTQGDYEKTMVVDVSKSGSISQDKLTGIISTYSKVKVTVGKLPPVEAAPAGAEILVILGTDFSEAY